MELIVRYGCMRFDPNIIGIIGAGDYSKKDIFYDSIRKVNWSYKKKDFVDADDFSSGAIALSRFVTDNKSPNEVFAQFAEFDLRNFKGKFASNALVLEERLVKKFGDSCRRHLVVKGQDGVIEVLPNHYFFGGRFGRDYEIKEYLDGSFDEFVRSRK